MLAIVIPYYNYAFFEETLQSLEKQENKKFKVYIGNDASPDDPENLIEKYREKLNIKYKYFEENLGQKSLVQQWERCLELTDDEEWIMILGDDDYLSENYVSEFYHHLSIIEKLHINVVRFASQMVFQTELQLKIFKNPVLEESTQFLYRKYSGAGRGTLSEQIFRRDAYLKYKFKDFPLAWGVDDIAWLEFSEFGNTYGINSATAYIRISHSNISRKGFKTELKLDTKFVYLEYLIANHLNKFKKEHRLLLINQFEVTGYLALKFSFLFYKRIFNEFLYQKRYLEFFKFQRRFFKRYFKHIGIKKIDMEKLNHII